MARCTKSEIHPAPPPPSQYVLTLSEVEATFVYDILCRVAGKDTPHAGILRSMEVAGVPDRGWKWRNDLFVCQGINATGWEAP